mgnify:FL=1
MEWVKKEPSSETNAVLYAVLVRSLKLLHPFMPFVTEAIWQDLPHAKKSVLMAVDWGMV